jgi:hypothetical protein
MGLLPVTFAVFLVSNHFGKIWVSRSLPLSRRNVIAVNSPFTTSMEERERCYMYVCIKHLSIQKMFTKNLLPTGF